MQNETTQDSVVAFELAENMRYPVVSVSHLRLANVYRFVCVPSRETPANSFENVRFRLKLLNNMCAF